MKSTTLEQIEGHLEENKPYPLGHRYVILASLGEGGFAYTFLAKDKIRNTLVALKMLKEPVFTTADEKLKSFTLEWAHLLSFDHPAIPKGLDMQVIVDIIGDKKDVEEEPKPTERTVWITFIVMERIVGNPLTRLLQSEIGKGFNEAAALKTVRCVAEALEYIEKRGVYHRDVTSNNIMVNDRLYNYWLGEGDEIRVALLDFGLAGSDFPGPYGTAIYMPLERLRRECLDFCLADIYSLTVVLHHILFSRHPYNTDPFERNPTNAQMIRAMLNSKPDMGDHCSIKDVHPLTIKLILRGLDLDPPRRFASFVDFINSIDEILELIAPD